MKKKIFGFVVIALLSFATWQCIQQPLAPLLPNWDTQLSIPLVDTAYYMRDAFKNDSDFTTSPLGGKNIYQFKPPVYQFTPLFIGDTTYLQLNPTTTDTSIGQTLGNLDLGNGTTGLVTYNAAKLVAGSTPAHDVNTNQDTTYTFPSIDPTTTTEIDPVPSLNVFAIPETSVTYSYTIPPDTTLVSATLVNGSIQVTVINGLPFTDSLATVKVVNDLGDTIATFNMANIPGNGQTTTPPPVSLVGKHLTSGLTAIIYNTTSTAILPATFTPGAALTVEFNLNGPLLASTVVARLPPRVITDTVTQETVLDDSTYLDTATFKRGSIAITLNNTVDAGISFRFRFDQLIRNSDGAVFEDTTALGPKSDTTATFNLDNTPGGYHFVGATSTNALSYSLHIATLSINHPSVINSTDGLSIRVQLLNTPFLLHSLSGRLVPTVIPMNQGAKLGLPAGGSGFTADSIVADSAAMKLRFYTAAGHTTDFYLTMYAYRNGVFIPPTIPLAVPRFIPGQPDTFSFVSAQIRNFLLSFPNNEPDSMLLSGNIVIDPPDRYAAGEIATINDTMHMYASAGIVFPLSVGIYNGLFADTLDIGNSQNGGQTIDPDLLNSLISGKFNFSFKNSIPFDLVLSTTFIRVDSTAIPPVTSVILPPDSVGRVRINASDTALTSTIYLTRSNTSKFGKANKMIVNLSLNTSSGVAALDSTQSVRIRMWGNIVFNVNPDKLKNK